MSVWNPNGNDENVDWAPPQQQPQQPQPAKSRWSYHLENAPSWATGAAEGWAKSIYDNQGISDPNSYLQQQAAAFRSQHGQNAPEDDASVYQMIASGQTPQQKQQAAPPTVAQQWNNPAVQGQVDEQAALNKQRSDELWEMLMSRAQQQPVDRNNPAIRQQADAYAANEERSSRNYLADVAEKAGPLANMRGEQRLAAERVGQRTGAFEADLVGRELTAERDRVQQSIEMLVQAGQFDKAQTLQQQLALLDNAIKQQGLGLQKQGLDQDWQRALMSNDQFLRSLGLDEWIAGNNDYYRRAGI